MARLHEFQGKQILAQAGIAVPRGGAASDVNTARQLAESLGVPAVVKAQAWVTSRAAKKLIHFVETPDDAAQAANALLGQPVGNFNVDTVLVEERLPVEREFYLGLIVDDRERRPVVILSSVGGSGIEEIAREHPDRVASLPVDIRKGLQDFEARDLARRLGIQGKLLLALSNLMVKFYDVARSYDARSAEINPLALTTDGKLVALDCRITVDDYAVFRHPDLGIEIAREMDRPPTELERIAWNVEKNDYRGTFYFLQLESEFRPEDRVVGFHGSGGGGSMMNMDALLARGFKIANFVDTSGNPPASKVYRAARIILSQPRVDAYYMGGSGVASQEQFHSARGLVKAFMDAQLNVPAVIRVGGNGEEQAIEILERANGAFPGPVEAYGRDDSPEFCVERLVKLVENYTPAETVTPREAPPMAEPYTFETISGGTVAYDHALCAHCETKACIKACVPQILSLDGEVPVLNITREEAKRGGCIECLACEVECYFQGNKGGYITLPVPGLDE
ncbi:MAG: ATP-grasp domain-containing protein [Chloroflexota bacterium]